MPWYYIGLTVGCVLAVWVLAMLHFRYHARRPAVGAHDGRLRPCPPTPNCVCTQDATTRHHADALLFRGSPADALQRLTTILARMPRVQIIAVSNEYLHAEFRSRLFRFVDDVEFLLDSGAKVIHFRSASRAGRSDFGVNRRRMEAIRQDFMSSERETGQMAVQK